MKRQISRRSTGRRTRGFGADGAHSGRDRRALGVVVLTGSLLLGACSTEGAFGPGLIGGPGDEVTLRGCAAATPLVPARVTDVCGQRILDAVTARLLRYDARTGEPELDIAESIETTDNQNFTVTLVPGYRFQDGTEVTAQSFVDAWSWAADPDNKAEAAPQFAIIDGAEALAAGDESGATFSSPDPAPDEPTEPDEPAPTDGPLSPAPTAQPTGPTSTPSTPGSGVQRPKTLRGLEIKDQRTFTIRTTEPVTDLEGTLVGTAFAPMPEGFFTGPEAVERFGKLPIGAGPFTVAANTSKKVELQRFAEYSGVAKPQIERAVLQNIDDAGQTIDLTRAYNLVVDNKLDVTEAIPTDRLYADQWIDDLPGRYLRRDSGPLQQLLFSEHDKQLEDVRVRRAISMAIDRPLVVKQIFNGNATPAASWVPPTVTDRRGLPTDGCGSTCEYDPAAARELFEAAGGYDGTFTLTVSGDDGNKQWADSVCNQLKNALELNCQVRLAATNGELLGQARSANLTGMVGQQLVQRPTAIDQLAGHAAKSSQNWTGYRNPEFELALNTAKGAEGPEADEALATAEKVLATDLPSVPTWNTATTIAWSDRVTDVEVTPLGTVDLTRIRIK